MTLEEKEKLRMLPIAKANVLIQKARYDLSAPQYKILVYVLSQIKPDDIDFHTQQFTLKELCEVCGFSKHPQNLKRIADNIKSIRDLSYWLETNNKYVLFTWFQSAKIDKTKNNLITIKLDEDLKENLLCLKDFITIFESGFLYAMKSKYSMHLYEILKSYENLKEYTFDVEELKQLLQTAEYDRYNNFKVKVIEPAIEEINKRSDITVSYTPIRDGRNITKINFKINRKSNFDVMLIREKNNEILEERITRNE